MNHQLKKIALTALAAASLPGMAQQVSYSVDGTYAVDGKKIYLIDRLTDQAIDSVVVAGGTFSFSGSADKNAFLGIRAEEKSWQTLFFNDGTPVKVNVNDSTLTGSPLNERMTRYDLEQEMPHKALMAKINKMTEEEIMARQDEVMSELNKVMDGQIAFANKIFQQERQSLIPLAFAELYFLDNGTDAYDELVAEQLPFSSHPFLQKARDKVAEILLPKESPKNAFIGQPFTDFEMADPDGKTYRLSSLVGEGKWVLVDFWASWCMPCRAEMPNVLEAYNKYHAKGFEVVGISLDEKKAPWLRAVDQLKMPWLQLSDLKGFKSDAASAYKIDAIPDNILIDPQGKIVDRALRGKALHNRLQKIFGE